MPTQPNLTVKKESVEARVVSLEEHNAVAEQKAADDRTISLKEIYERVIALETRLDMIMADNKSINMKFTNLTYVMLVMLTVNGILSLLNYLAIHRLLP